MRTVLRVGMVCTALAVCSVCAANEVYWVPAHDLVPQDYCCTQVTSGDLDCDGDIDLAFITRHYWNTGTPQAPVWEYVPGVYNGTGTCMGRETALGDIDADGDLDLLRTCQFAWEGKFHLYENVGSPGPPAWQEVVGALDHLPYSAGPLEPSFADLDGDGDLDLLLANEFGLLILIENTGTPQIPVWSDRGPVPGVSLSYADPAADLGDLDGDGDLDIVSISWEDGVQSWENVGSEHSFEFEENPSMLLGVDCGTTGNGIELFDIDADGDLDLLVSPGTGENLFYLNEQIVLVERSSWTSIKALYR